MVLLVFIISPFFHLFHQEFGPPVYYDLRRIELAIH